MNEPTLPSSSTERIIKWSTASAVLCVATVAAVVSYDHAYALVREYGEDGWTARLVPLTVDGLIYASSMVMLHSARHRVIGSDIMDFNPRGSYPNNCAPGAWPASVGEMSIDPCEWFVMTNKHDDTADPATLKNNNHHHGTDWMYGGWDRDVMQGDRAQNGPNNGDRMIDWNGNFNLFTHCNAAYGGYNDIRGHSPAVKNFLYNVSWGSGAGQAASDASTEVTSAYRELAMVYPGENEHGSGSAYPGTPGHFDSPVACSD